MKPSDAKLHELATRLAGLQKRAKALGVFTNDRELLECLRCGLMEDVTSTGLLITCRVPALGEDTERPHAAVAFQDRCGSLLDPLPEWIVAGLRHHRLFLATWFKCARQAIFISHAGLCPAFSVSSNSSRFYRADPVAIRLRNHFSLAGSAFILYQRA